MKKLPAITPGEILLEEYLKPMEIFQNSMARAIGMPPRAINEIVLGRRSITPTISIRFGAFFGQTPEFQHGMQVECDSVPWPKTKATHGQNPPGNRAIPRRLKSIFLGLTRMALS